MRAFQFDRVRHTPSLMISDLQLALLVSVDYDSILLISVPTEWFVACKEREFKFSKQVVNLLKVTCAMRKRR